MSIQWYRSSFFHYLPLKNILLKLPLLFSSSKEMLLKSGQSHNGHFQNRRSNAIKCNNLICQLVSYFNHLPTHAYYFNKFHWLQTLSEHLKLFLQNFISILKTLWTKLLNGKCYSSTKIYLNLTLRLSNIIMLKWYNLKTLAPLNAE